MSGLAHFNLQEYKGAVADFEAAYRLMPDPVFLYNLAQSHRLAENPERAVYFYRAYLRASSDTRNRGEVERRIELLERLIADKSKVAAPPDHTLPPADEVKTRAAVSATPLVAAMPNPNLKPRGTSRDGVPIYRRWWLWTMVGVVASGAAIGIAVAVTSTSGNEFNAGLGTVGPAALRGAF